MLRSIRAVAAALALLSTAGGDGARAQDNAPPVDARSIPPDLRPWTEEENARDLALWRTANAAIDRGDYREGETGWRELLAIRQATWGPDHPMTMVALGRVASSLSNQTRYAESETLQRQVLAARERRLGRAHFDTAVSARDLAVVLTKLSRAREAEALLRRAAATIEAQRGASDIELGFTLSALASALEHQSRMQEAEPFYRRALAIAETVDGGDNPMAAVSLGNLGYLLHKQNRHTEAEPYFRRALQMAERLQGADHPLTAMMLGNLATNLNKQERYAEAEPFARRAMELREKRLGPSHLETALSQNTLAGTLIGLKKHAEAEPYLRRSLEVYEAQLGADHPDVAFALNNLAVALDELDRDDEAAALHARSLTIYRAQMGDDYPFTVEAAENLAYIQLRRNDYAAAFAAAWPALQSRGRAWRFYERIFGAPEIADLLAGKSRWLIAPQGPLASLPFAVLVTKQPQGDDANPAALRATSWLGLTKTLAILPSVSALRVQRLHAPSAPAGSAPFFGVGDPAFTGRADRETRDATALSKASDYFRGAGADLARLATLPRLPGTAAEIRGLAQSFGAGRDSYLLQLDATEAELRRRNASGALARAEVVAFATHGLLAGDFAFLAEPALALTPPVLPAGTTVSPDNDGLLTASEATALTLSARFVILSACTTAAGGAPDAEALSGLARAFFYAGAQSLLVSHYPVFDDAAQRLTVEAARIARAQGLRNPETMRQSMLALMRDASADAGGRSFAHPASWAPFAVLDAS